MTEPVPQPAHVSKRRWCNTRKTLAWVLGLLVGCVGLLALASWGWTADLEESDASGSPPDWPTSRDSSTTSAESSAPALTAWPETVEEGDDAKHRLLAIIEEAERDLRGRSGHRARFKRLERIKGRLGPWQTIELKVFHDPVSIYMKFLEPEAGKEAIYSQGRFDDQLIAHPGGMARFLAPRLKLDPSGPLALTDNRHPITSAGLLNLVQRLLHFRRLDLTHPTSHLRLDQFTAPDGRLVLRSRHRHLKKTDQHPYSRSEIWYDPATRLPIRVENHDWPAGTPIGQLVATPEDLADPFALFETSVDSETLVEIYEYHDLDFETPLTPLDFDPANPAYGFRRF